MLFTPTPVMQRMIEQRIKDLRPMAYEQMKADGTLGQVIDDRITYWVTTYGELRTLDPEPDRGLTDFDQKVQAVEMRNRRCWEEAMQQALDFTPEDATTD